MDIEKIVIESAAAAYMVPEDQITPSTDIRKDLSNKSMQMLAFISGIENECGVAIPLGQTGELITIQDFIDKAKQQL